jgi:hypothetical protein
MVWISSVRGSKDIYIGLFNIANNAHNIDVDFSKLGIKGKVTVKDLWKKMDVGNFRNKYVAMINAHGCALLRIKVH